MLLKTAYTKKAWRVLGEHGRGRVGECQVNETRGPGLNMTLVLPLQAHSRQVAQGMGGLHEKE